jgi:thioredoxin reductase (NADPH)
VEQVRTGQDLYATGDSSYDLFLLGSARVDILQGLAVIYRGSPGDFLGELSLLTGQHVYLTARVVSAGSVVRVGAAALRRVIAEQVDIADVLIEAFRVRREAIGVAAGDALEIVGRPGAAESRALRTYVSQLNLPHSWVDATSVAGLTMMRSAGLGEQDLPAAMVHGSALPDVTPVTLAEALGLTYRPGDRPADLVVVGAGPAGLAAAVYGASEGLTTVLLDRAGLGGQAATSARIENYLGFPQGISGPDLTRLAMVQALKFGVRISSPCTVTGLDLTAPLQPAVLLRGGLRIESRAVIAATGAHYRRLAIAGLAAAEKSGRIRYAATELDVRGYANQPVAVVGGANSAGQAALSLAAHGSDVDLILRGPALDARMSSYLTERIHAHRRIRLHVRTVVREFTDADVLVVERHDGRTDRLECRALFCFIGADPVSDWLTGVAKDENGFVLTDGTFLPHQTSEPAVFAVGDLRSGSTKRVATAVGEGASAVSSVHAMLAGEGLD